MAPTRTFPSNRCLIDERYPSWQIKPEMMLCFVLFFSSLDHWQTDELDQLITRAFLFFFCFSQVTNTFMVYTAICCTRVRNIMSPHPYSPARNNETAERTKRTKNYLETLSHWSKVLNLDWISPCVILKFLFSIFHLFQCIILNSLTALKQLTLYLLICLFICSIKFY